MKKFVIFPIIFVILLSSCTATHNGQDLLGFIDRLNELNNSYTVEAEGFLFNEQSNEFSKFFKFQENEILLKFNIDDKGRLTAMNIVFENNFIKNESAYEFLLNSIKAFICNDETSKKLLTDDFLKQFNCECPETHKNEVDNIKTLIDVTDLGTVITIYKDI